MSDCILIRKGSLGNAILRVVFENVLPPKTVAFKPNNMTKVWVNIGSGDGLLYL